MYVHVIKTHLHLKYLLKINLLKNSSSASFYYVYIRLQNNFAVHRVLQYHLSVSVSCLWSQIRATKLEGDVSRRARPLVEMLRISREQHLPGTRERVSRSLWTLRELAIAPRWGLVSFWPLSTNASIIDASELIRSRINTPFRSHWLIPFFDKF